MIPKASGARSILGMSVHGTSCFITVPRNLQVGSRILKAEFVTSLITVITLCWALSCPINWPSQVGDQLGSRVVDLDLETRVQRLQSACQVAGLLSARCTPHEGPGGSS